MNRQINTYPAPWNLQGKGYIFIYKFKKTFVEKSGNIPDFLKNRFCGGFGSVMLVDYEKSDAGPYGELLFIPGKFHFGRKKLDTISRIYVSTMESVINGRANWGIPKEKADFTFEKSDENTEKATISVNGTTAAEFIIKTGKLSFPVSTKLLPFPLVQKHDGRLYFTNFSGKGKGHLAKVMSLKIDPTLFPDVSVCRPIAAVRVDPFDITFPKAIVSNAE